MRVVYGVLGIALVFVSSNAPAGDCFSAAACYHMAMPLYDQRDPSFGSYWLPNGPSRSMLCGPTSGAMALQAVYGALWSEEKSKVGGWTRTSFVNKTRQQQIIAMAYKMSTDPRDGTTYIPWDPPVISYGMNAGLPHRATRAGDFPVAGGSGGSVSGWGPVVSVGRYVNRMRSAQKSADIILHGKYSRDVTSILGVDTVTFWRDGGHIVAVRGHESIAGLFQSVVIHDPSYAQRQNRMIGQLHAGTEWGSWHGIPYIKSVTILPTLGFQSSYLYSEGNTYRIIDGELGLWAGIPRGAEPIHLTPSLLNTLSISGTLAP